MSKATSFPWQVNDLLAAPVDWQIIAASHNCDKIATILGNRVMIEAYKAGIPGNGKPFPDGAKMAKIHWTAKKAEDQPDEPVVPGPPA